MDVIDAKWIADRLPERRGKGRGIRIALANHMGLDQPKLSKILSGTRGIKSQEAALAVDFFARLERGEIDIKNDDAAHLAPQTTAFSEDAIPFDTSGRSPEHALSALCYAATTPELFTARHDMPGFCIANGDLLIVDLARGPGFGELAMIAYRDESSQDSTWAIRRWMGDAMLSGDARGTVERVDGAGIATQARGVIVAVARALAPEPTLTA